MHLIRAGLVVAGALGGALLALSQRWGAASGCPDLVQLDAAGMCAEPAAATWAWVLSAAVGAALGWFVAPVVRRKVDG